MEIIIVLALHDCYKDSMRGYAITAVFATFANPPRHTAGID